MGLSVFGGSAVPSLLLFFLMENQETATSCTPLVAFFPWKTKKKHQLYAPGGIFWFYGSPRGAPHQLWVPESTLPMFASADQAKPPKTKVEQSEGFAKNYLSCPKDPKIQG